MPRCVALLRPDRKRAMSVLAAAILLLTAAGAAAGHAAAPLPSAASGAANPMVASVEGHPIHLSDLRQEEPALPASLRNLPFAALYPVLLNRAVDHAALVILARRHGLEHNPAVQRQIEEATDRILEAALLRQDAVPKVTEAAVKARYEQLYGHSHATPEVRARHILIASKAEAEKLIAELRHGADFASLARKYSEDPDGKQGGDLGFFRRDQVSPAFAAVAFSLQPGQVADQPVHNAFGWHVIQVEESRLVPPPSLRQVRDQIRNQLMQQAVRQEVALARSQLTIHAWNLDGSAIEPAAGASNGGSR